MGITLARRAACAGAVLVGFAACNVFTGADDIRFADDDDGTGTGSSSNQAGVGGGGSGVGGQGTGAGINTSELLPSDVASITSIELYQGVRRPLMLNGAPASSNVPLVAGREAMMRIFYTTSMPVNLTVAVTIGQAQPIVLTGALNGTSNLQSLTSTINVPIPGELLQAGAGYRVELLESPELTSGQNPGSVYPAGGQEQLPLQSVGGPLKLVLVPILYGADGSNRAPDTSAGQIENYRKRFQAYYPVPDVEVTVTSPMQWNSTVSPNGSGWGALLDAVSNVRQSQNAAFNEHYYGVFSPSSSFNNYCSGGCVLGLSWLADSPSDAWARAGIGIGFSGGVSTDTAAHEIGHQHGREHAPCEVNDPDPGFPHNGGVIGEWGFDLLTGQLVQPSTPDFMGYCDPTWVSDYTYNALFNRLASVNGASWHFDPSTLDRTYERIRIDDDGVHWGEPITLHTPPMGQLTTVTLEHEQGDEDVTGRFYPYSHLPGGLLLFERREHRATRVSFEIQGLRRVVQRQAVH